MIDPPFRFDFHPSVIIELKWDKTAGGAIEQIKEKSVGIEKLLYFILFFSLTISSQKRRIEVHTLNRFPQGVGV